MTRPQRDKGKYRSLHSEPCVIYASAFLSCALVFGVDPDLIQDGSTIPIAKLFQDITQKSVMMLPLGAVDDGEHAQNEKINR